MYLIWISLITQQNAKLIPEKEIKLGALECSQLVNFTKRFAIQDEQNEQNGSSQHRSTQNMMMHASWFCHSFMFKEKYKQCHSQNLGKKMQ